MDLLCDLCGLFSALPCKCRCCDNLCCCCCGGDSLEGFWNVPDSDLEIVMVHHIPNCYYLMTAANKRRYEQQAAGGLLSFDKEILNAISPADRIVFTDVKKGDASSDAKHDALKLLMSGIQEHESRQILGADKVSLDGLAVDGITTSAQLRARRTKEQT